MVVVIAGCRSQEGHARGGRLGVEMLAAAVAVQLGVTLYVWRMVRLARCSEEYCLAWRGEARREHGAARHGNARHGTARRGVVWCSPVSGKLSAKAVSMYRHRSGLGIRRHAASIGERPPPPPPASLEAEAMMIAAASRHAPETS